MNMGHQDLIFLLPKRKNKADLDFMKTNGWIIDYCAFDEYNLINAVCVFCGFLFLIGTHILKHGKIYKTNKTLFLTNTTLETVIFNFGKHIEKQSKLFRFSHRNMGWLNIHHKKLYLSICIIITHLKNAGLETVE